MTDRELLEKAARAAGMIIDKSPYSGGGTGNTGFDAAGNAVLDWHNGQTWNPLRDDGDALRLAVKLGLRVQCVELDHSSVDDGNNEGPRIWQAVTTKFDPYAATRRAIVRAAAAIADSTDAKE
jgi:hypothetical protein